MSQGEETARLFIERFSSRVENYIKYRPQYPPQVLRLLQTELNLTPSSVVADIGSGTGFLSRVFLANGNVVYGVEPNQAMRAAGENLLRGYANFHSVDGVAEATTLNADSIDFVTAGQAFHWFDIDRTRNEFARILCPHGWAVLIWNDRRRDTTPFLIAYEKLLMEFGTDYKEVMNRNVNEQTLQRFFQGNFESKIFDNHQLFDYESLKGRLLSSSYAPPEEHPRYAAMIEVLHKIFSAHQVNGRVSFDYDTQVFYGHIES